MSYVQLCRLWAGRWCWVPPLVAVVAILGALSLAYAGKDAIPYAGEDTDQTLLVSVGFHKNGGTGKAMSAQYKHPTAQWLQTYFSLDRALVDDNSIDRTEALIGIQVYPLRNRFYVQLGGGAAKTGSSTESVFTGALGYELDISTDWFADIHGGADWNVDGESRWALLFGLGKRF